MDKEVYGIIYSIYSKADRKLYIGATTQEGGFNARYKGDVFKYTHNEELLKSLLFYGVENFIIREEIDIAYSKEELYEKEKFYIRVFNTNNPKNGFNKTEGGSDGKPNSSTRKRLSENNARAMSKKVIVITKEKSYSFNSAVEASNHFGVNKDTFRNWCNGKSDVTKSKISKEKGILDIYYDEC